MRIVRALTAMMLIACGCSRVQHAPPPVQAAIEARLTQYRDAWEAGNADGVRDVFAIASPQDQAFADAMARMASAQFELRSETRNAAGPFLRIMLGKSLPPPIVAEQWRSYALRTRDPREFIVDPPYVIARRSKDDPPPFYLREVLGHWKVDTKTFARFQPLDAVTKSIERSIANTTETIAAVKARDIQAIQKLAIQDAFGSLPPEQMQRLREILGVISAKENPP